MTPADQDPPTRHPQPGGTVPHPPMPDEPDEWSESALRRRARRTAIGLLLRVRRPDGSWTPAKALNVSLTGALIRTQPPALPEGHTASCEFMLEGGEPMLVDSVVVRSAGEAGQCAVGVRFGDIPTAFTRLIGRLLEAEFNLGHFQLITLIATGGMAEIYLAQATEGPHKGQLVALKRIRAEHASDPTIRTLIEREAEILSLLDVPGIVRVLDVKVTPDTCYMAMEHVDGATVDQLIRAGADRGDRVPPLLAAYIARKVARTLHGVHNATDRAGGRGNRLGLVHRDVTPGNILISRDGDVRLADFGVVQVSLRPAEGIDSDELVVGTRGFIPPESLLGTGMDATCDVFALGATLYRMLSGGEDAFGGVTDSMAFRRTLNGRFQKASSVAPGVPRELDGVIKRALASRRASGKDDTPAERFLDLLRLGFLNRTRRFASADAMADALEALDPADRRDELAWVVNTWWPADQT